MDDMVAILMPLLAVAAVIAAAYLTTRWMARHQGAHSSGRHIQVVERVALAKDTYLALIRVGGKIYLASIGAGRVELIRQMDEEELPKMESQKAGGDFFKVLATAMKGNKPQQPKAPDDGQDGVQL